MPTPIRVDAILPSFAAGGSERVSLSLLTRLPKDAFSVRLLVINPSGPLAPMAVSLDQLVQIGTKRLRNALPRLISEIRRCKPDYLFCSQIHINIAMLAAAPLLGNTRIVVREANMPSLCLSAGHWPAWHGWAYRRLLPRAHRIVATSQKMANEFVHTFGASRGRVVVLRNSVDVDVLRQLAIPVIRMPGPGRRFVAVGRLVPQKGFDRLVPLMRRCAPEDRLTVVGDGPQMTALRDMAKAAHVEAKIEFVGFDATPWPTIAGADALLMPSRWEGMPNAALEALACGTPVIAAETSGGIAEVSASARNGAVTVVSDDNVFLDAMLSVRPAPKADPAASLLPADYARIRAIEAFKDLYKL